MAKAQNSGKGGPGPPAAQLTLADLESLMVAILDLNETFEATLGRPLSHAELKKFLFVAEHLDTETISAECALLVGTRGKYLLELYTRFIELAKPNDLAGNDRRTVLTRLPEAAVKRLKFVQRAVETLLEHKGAIPDSLKREIDQLVALVASTTRQTTRPNKRPPRRIEDVVIKKKK